MTSDRQISFSHFTLSFLNTVLFCASSSSTWWDYDTCKMYTIIYYHIILGCRKFDGITKVTLNILGNVSRQYKIQKLVKLIALIFSDLYHSDHRKFRKDQSHRFKCITWSVTANPKGLNKSRDTTNQHMQGWPARSDRTADRRNNTATIPD